MNNIFKKILYRLKRNEKKLSINSSGSIPGAKLEKIRSGQAYLYQKNGMESEVIEINFKNKIWGSSLNNALTLSLKRYPYLNTKLVELDGDFYIVKNEIGLVAKKTKKLAKLGHISCGYHLIDITYFDKTIYISFHHALCDGKGIKPFVETLIYYYCQTRYKSDASSEGIRLANASLLPNESKEPNIGSYDYDETTQTVNISRDGFALEENIIEEHDVDYRYYVEINTADYLKTCKENGATPVILTSLLMSRGIAKIYPNFDKSIIANIAVDIREALDLPNTFKNCVRSMPLPYTRDFLNKTLKEQAEVQRKLLNEQRNRDLCRKAANDSLALFNKLDTLKCFEEKQKMMEFFNGMLINTYVISYLGKMILNENEQYIDNIGFYNSGAVGLGITMLCVGNKFCLNFKQSFKSEKYVKTFCDELKKYNIKFSVSKYIEFVTPKDAIIKRKNWRKN